MLKRVQFSPEELEVRGEFSTTKKGAIPRKRYSTPVMPKENYREVFNRRLPLWIPCENDTKQMFPGVNPDNHARGQIFEASHIPPEEIVDFHDMFGIKWVYDFGVGGSMVVPGAPLLTNVNDWESAIKFPDIDKWDWEGARKANAEFVSEPDRLLTITISTGLFERLISFMDFQNAALALIDEDQGEALHALFSRLCDLYDSIIGKYKECFNPDLICFHDDWGGQQSPFFSLGTVREMLVPYLSRVAESVHSRGMFLDLHSCGKIEMLVPAMIEAGVDSWTGQPMNDKDFLYERYGDRLILGVDPDVSFGPELSDEEAVAAAKRFVARYAPNYETKPVLAYTKFVAPNSYIETVYEESRKYFS